MGVSAAMRRSTGRLTPFAKSISTAAWDGAITSGEVSEIGVAVPNVDGMVAPFWRCCSE